jgi:hypothetical protein
MRDHDAREWAKGLIAIALLIGMAIALWCFGLNPNA